MNPSRRSFLGSKFVFRAYRNDLLLFDVQVVCIPLVIVFKYSHNFICILYSDGVRLVIFSNWAMKWVTLLYPDS